jgi:hypothetical protein
MVMAGNRDPHGRSSGETDEGPLVLGIRSSRLLETTGSSPVGRDVELNQRWVNGRLQGILAHPSEAKPVNPESPFS